jgi:hypothetical protein
VILRVLLPRSWKHTKLSSHPWVCWIWWYLSICWFRVGCLFVFVICCVMFVILGFCVIWCFMIVFFSFVHFRMLSSKAEGKLWQFENYPGYFRLYDKLAVEKLGPDGTLYYSVMPNGFAIQWCGGTACCRVCPGMLSICFSGLCEAICFSCAVNNTWNCCWRCGHCWTSRERNTESCELLNGI